jgi:hypothetical protein
MADGYLNKCKECTRKDVKGNRENNVEYYREYDRERANQPHRVAAMQEYNEQYRLEHPLRYLARNIVNNAVRDGKLIPWPVCAVPECNGKPEAHHADYSRPLDVVWLCSVHHKQVHEK